MLVKMLLTFGAYVNPVNAEGSTPLDMAIEHKFCNMVAYLVSVGGNTAENLNAAGPLILHPLQPFERVRKLDIKEFKVIGYQLKLQLIRTCTYILGTCFCSCAVICTCIYL